MFQVSPGGSVVKESACKKKKKESACNTGNCLHAEDMSSIPRSGRYPAEGNGNRLQYSCLGNPIDKGADSTTVHGITRGRHGLTTNHTTPT